MSDVRAKKAQSSATVKVHIDIEGAPEIKVRFLGGYIVPNHLVITYRYEVTQNEDGWTEYTWRCTDVSASGDKVLKPGPNGEQRLSDKIGHTTRWYGRDLEEPPEFIKQSIEFGRPSGRLDLTEL